MYVLNTKEIFCQENFLYSTLTLVLKKVDFFCQSYCQNLKQTFSSASLSFLCRSFRLSPDLCPALSTLPCATSRSSRSSSSNFALSFFSIASRFSDAKISINKSWKNTVVSKGGFYFKEYKGNGQYKYIYLIPFMCRVLSLTVILTTYIK